MEMQGPPIIVGMGAVGQATAYQLFRGGYPKVIGVDVVSRRRIPAHMPRGYRRFVDWRTELPIVKHGCYFLCLSAPTTPPRDEDARWSGGAPQDTTAIEQTLYALRGAEAKIILRSTVLPEKFHAHVFDDLVDYAWPLFVREGARLIHSVRYPDFEVVGARSSAALAAFPFTSKFGRAREPRLCCGFGSRQEAMAFKYLHSLWTGLRTAFVNELDDCLRAGGIAEPRPLIDTYFGGTLTPGKPFGGPELPYDIAAWVGAHLHRATIADATTYSNLLREASANSIQLRFPRPTTVQELFVAEEFAQEEPA